VRLDPNIKNADTFYAAIILANEMLSEQQSQDFAMRLVLLLANQISDARVLAACIAEAAKPFSLSNA
jgi:flagellar biosynthesis regulator FlbT